MCYMNNSTLTGAGTRSRLAVGAGAADRPALSEVAILLRERAEEHVVKEGIAEHERVADLRTDVVVLHGLAVPAIGAAPVAAHGPALARIPARLDLDQGAVYGSGGGQQQQQQQWWRRKLRTPEVCSVPPQLQHRHRLARARWAGCNVSEPSSRSALEALVRIDTGSTTWERAARGGK